MPLLLPVVVVMLFAKALDSRRVMPMPPVLLGEVAGTYLLLLILSPLPTPTAALDL